MDWIDANERLPEEGRDVLICVMGGSDMDVARISLGISKEQRKKMHSGEIDNPEIPTGAPFYISTKRSLIVTASDEHGNNLVPYRFRASTGAMEYFGQEVTHWMPLPEPPKM